ncbi:MAG: tRNA (N(6)-L-threonylcarbamoyladenosine(37)-C(2))-methylthiotransferase MtaB [Bacteroidales bacterium]
MKRIAFYTLGCKLNFSETSALAQQFADAAYQIVEFAEVADIYVINTCTVTSAAEKKGRQIIQRAVHKNPKARIAVIGCFAELRPEEIRALDGVDYVLGTQNKHLLLECIENNGEIADHGKTISPVFVGSYSNIGRTRSFFKIQDGCDNFCSYCAIPYARGRSCSDTVENTGSVAEKIASQGVKEIVLTGVNIGDFGRKNGENFYQLLRKLVLIDGVERYRISSIEPDLLTDEIIDLVAENGKIMPHFHIPLQAGNDEVLEKMKRRYRCDLFRDRVDRIKKVMPDAFVAADIIAGFPTETKSQFEDACRFVESLPLSALHVFSYSPRPEALSWNFKSVYPMEEKKERSRQLHCISDRKKSEFYKSFIGEHSPVLWEADTSEGYMFGYTPNYLKVKIPQNKQWVNTVEMVRLEQLKKDGDKDWVFEGFRL